MLVNDQPATLQRSMLARSLVEMHGQNEPRGAFRS